MTTVSIAQQQVLQFLEDLAERVALDLLEGITDSPFERTFYSLLGATQVKSSEALVESLAQLSAEAPSGQCSYGRLGSEWAGYASIVAGHAGKAGNAIFDTSRSDGWLLPNPFVRIILVALGKAVATNGDSPDSRDLVLSMAELSILDTLIVCLRICRDLALIVAGVPDFETLRQRFDMGELIAAASARGTLYGVEPQDVEQWIRLLVLADEEDMGVVMASLDSQLSAIVAAFLAAAIIVPEIDPANRKHAAFLAVLPFYLGPQLRNNEVYALDDEALSALSALNEK